MPMDRRTFIRAAASGVAVGALSPASLLRAATGPRLQAVAFDAFPIFDPRPVLKLTETLFPGKGAQLGEVWRTRQFEYQWLRALSGRYVDFWQATEAGLTFAARKLDLELTGEKRDRLMGAFLQLKAWPDVPVALKTLKEAGVRLAFLSNMTAEMLRTNMRNADLEPLFDQVISTDLARTYKPDPRAYQLGVDVLQLKREEIAFAAFAGWDVAGAKWFGYPTFWVNRARFPVEELGVAADGVGTDLSPLVKFITG